ncbi:MAG: DNA-binding response regulator, partial [Bifidobacterium adolescentis]
MNQSNQGAGMSEREQRIRIAVVDDHEMFRAGVIATLQP